MGKAINLVGQQKGLLKILKRKRENNKTYYFYECKCGNTGWIRADALTKKNPTKSCGCLSKNTQFKAKDITNKVFGRLKAIRRTNKRNKVNGSVIWECKCKCGNITYVSEQNLIQGRVQSCGCLRKENSKNNIQKAIKKHLKEHIIEGTNIPVISRKTVKKNNTSGCTGVMWDKSRQKWQANIRFKGKVHYLNRYTNKEDAIKSRKTAEEKYFKPFLEKYNKE